MGFCGFGAGCEINIWSIQVGERMVSARFYSICVSFQRYFATREYLTSAATRSESISIRNTQLHPYTAIRPVIRGPKAAPVEEMIGI
jgi:hypothetical protein